MKFDKSTPPVCFCWYCGRRLDIRYYTSIPGPDGYNRTVHKRCAKRAGDFLYNKQTIRETFP